MSHPVSQLRRLLLSSVASVAALSIVAPVVSVRTVPEASATSVEGPWSSSGTWFDTTNRSAVIASYEAEFGQADPDSGWSGNRGSCDPGTTSAVYRDAVVDRVNWFRAMAGVPADLTENASLSALAQESALMMSATGQLSHTPSSSYECYTSTGAAASGASNLYLGRTGPSAITGYVEDPGGNNSSAGHRNWILHPTSTQIGTGDIPGSGGWASNSLYVIQDTSIVFGPQPTLRQNDGAVAWPPAGYVPADVVFDRWSLGLRDANFASANVSMSVGGAQVPVNIEHRSGGSSSAPFPIVVWNAPSLDTHPDTDTVVSVSVSGVTVGGQSRSFNYQTIIIGTEPPTDFSPFVSQAYSDFLGRSPSSSELSYWSAKLNSGSGRWELVNALSTSSEWTTVVVQNLYLGTLGRQADGPGAAYWSDRLQGGLSVANAASQFYGSSEYVKKTGGAWSGWLTELYQELMGRNPDQGGLTFWVAQSELRGSGLVAYDFYQSDESRRERVTELYERFLGRGPDAAGLKYWARVLESGDDLALAAHLAGSDEYFRQAG